jgi:uncharacterized protein
VRVSRQLLPCGIDYNAARRENEPLGDNYDQSACHGVGMDPDVRGAIAANNAPASDASIREMLELTNAQQMVAGMKGQMSAVMNTAMQNAMQGQTITPERQAIIDRMTAKISAVAADMLNWDALLPIYMRTYRDSFTQDEIDGVNKFYKSAAGKAYVKKLPLVVQNVMREMQGFMRPAQEKMMAIQRQSMQELKDLQDKDGKK